MKTRWQDWIILIFGLWLLISPWWLQYFTGRPYTDETAASWNSIFLGLAVAIVICHALVVVFVGARVLYGAPFPEVGS